MLASDLLQTLNSRGIQLRIDGVTLKAAPSSGLTAEDRQAIRDHKAELLDLLRHTERPPFGSIARPMVCRGGQMPADCPWDTCPGQVEAKGHGRYFCKICGTWFELKPE